MNIISINDIRNDLITYFKANSLVPILGSGFSRGCSTANRGIVPSGSDYKKHMLMEIFKDSELSDSAKKDISNYQFSKLCTLYEDDEYVPSRTRRVYMRTNLFKATFDKDDARNNVLHINWPYIYTLNIDDVIENSSEYKQVILPQRHIDEEIFDTEKCVIKLHGDISEILKYKDGCKIFTTTEYVRSLVENSVLLQKLKNDYMHQNIIFLGCSLDDEIDLMSIEVICKNIQSTQNFNRKIIFVKGQPEKYKIAEFKQFGITDIVYFDSYESMYQELYDIWLTSSKIATSELDSYKNYHINHLHNTDENKNYFFYGKSLIDSKKKEITIPYYYIQRDLCNNLLSRLDNNTIHIVRGNRISGKTYFLVDIYKSISDREIYLFDSRTRLTDKTLHTLLNKTKIICLFDSGSLTNKQFENILLNFKAIHNNESNFIISINESDIDLLGILNLKCVNNEIDSSKINIYNLFNKFESNETNSINYILPKLDFLPFNYKYTILDNIIKNEKILDVKGRFSHMELKINTYKELAFYIILATKEKIYSSEIVMFGLETEAYYAALKYSPLIELVDTDRIETSPSDLSNKKYILNSKYWLYRQLGFISSNKSNYNIVTQSYKYIVDKILNKYSANLAKQRQIYKNYILFDVINSIFIKEKFGQLPLIVEIYDTLHEKLANDYNFLHQNAKCFLKYSQTRKEVNEKETYLYTALRKAKVAYEICEQICHSTHNNNMFISLAHIQFTMAIINCQICKCHEYSIESEITYAIECIYDAIKNPYYLDVYRNDKENKSIITDFINNLLPVITCKNIKSKLNEISNIIIMRV